MKQNVHNILEVKALLKEELLSGDPDKYNGTMWYSHSGEYLCRSICTVNYLCRSICTVNIFHLEFPNNTVESYQIL